MPGHRSFGERARTEVVGLIEDKRWKGSFPSRLIGLFGVQWDLSRVLRGIKARGVAEGVPEEEIAETLRYARHTHRQALLLAHFEDVRALLSTWRFLHRWVALLMVLLMVVHIAYALSFGTLTEALRTRPAPEKDVPALQGRP